MRCKFCGELNDVASEQTVEHIFPQAIGGKVVLKPVHKKCNDFLGREVDVGLVDNRAILVRRRDSRLTGNSRKLANPFAQVTFRNQFGEPFIYDEKAGFKRTQDVVKTDDTLSVLFEVDPNLDLETQWEKFVAKVQKEMSNRRLRVPSREEIISHYESLDLLNKLEADVNFKPLAHWTALIKIVYELGVYWLGETYLDDPKAIELRNFIVNSSEEYAFLGDFEVVEDCKSSIWDVFNKPKKNHLAVLQLVDGVFVVKVRIFDAFDVTAVLSEHSDLYPDASNRFLSIDPVSKEVEDCPLRKAYGIVSQISPSIQDGAWIDINSWFRRRKP